PGATIPDGNYPHNYARVDVNGFYTADYRKLQPPQSGSLAFMRQGEGPAPSGPWSNPPVPATNWNAGQNTPYLHLPNTPGTTGYDRSAFPNSPVGDTTPPLPPGPPWTWTWTTPGGFRDGNPDERTNHPLFFNYYSPQGWDRRLPAEDMKHLLTYG